jgi:non-canonical purine NTP pyrophosphatase (RdgB/HAM1 family)
VYVLATLNEHKVAEVRQLPGAEGLDLRSVSEFGNPPEVVESGSTLEENAAIKAVKYSLWLRREFDLEPPVIAEDSGLLVEALLGWPGIDSARVAPTDEERIALVLSEMLAVELRAAHFMAYTALAINGHLIRTWRGVAAGRITTVPCGEHGFGYDPIFEDSELGITFAEMTQAQKNERSHRGKAWQQTFDYLRKHAKAA